MIEDALAGKIDLILTKSVSRFARNTVDSLVTIRQLKEKGVEVFFEKENIYTLDAKGELLLTIMSSLAQKEARSISENTSWVEESPSRTERSVSAIPISSVMTRVPMGSLLSMRSRQKSCGEFMRSSSPEKLRAALRKG